MTFSRLTPTPAVYSEPIAARSRLAALGLGPESLWDALNYGLAERNNLTANDPLWLWGILTSGKITRGLRDQLVPLGWEICNDRTYATVIHPNRLLQIAVSSGDTDTGNPLGHPATRVEKGIATELAVKSNQSGFHSILPDDFSNPTNPMPTYLFLYCMNDASGTASAELALPIGISDDGIVREWLERIPLFPVDFHEAERIPVDDDEHDDEHDGDPYHVEIERRVS